MIRSGASSLRSPNSPDGNVAFATEGGVKASFAGIPGTVWLIFALALIGRATVAAVSHFTNEDFFITLRYAENVAHGQGFVYNTGERVLGTTTPLFTLFLAGVSWAGLSPIPVAKLLGALADAALCVVVYRLLADLRYERAGRLAAFIIAVHPLHLRWSVSGMETSLVTLCGMAVWLVYVQRRYRAAYVLLGVLFLLRWDSVLLGGIVTVAILVRERRFPWRELAIFASIVLPWILFAWAYFGSPIPVTGIAKLTVYGWRLRNELFPHLPRYLYRFGGTVPYLLLTLAALAGARRIWSDRTIALAPAVVWFGAYVGLLATSRILLFEWYLVPPWPVYEALAAVGLMALGERLFARVNKERLRYVFAVFGCVTAVACVAGTASACRQTQAAENDQLIRIGGWLAENVQPGERVMLEPIGYIGAYSGRRMLDIVGLVTPEVLSSYRPEMPSPVLDISRRFRPEWAVLRPGELQHILDAGRATWEAQYSLVKTFTFVPRPGREPIVFHVFRRRVASR